MLRRMYFVYALGDPRDGSIYYIGFTANPAKRWSQHKGSSTVCWAYERNAEIKSDGLEPVFVVLACYEDKAQAKEQERLYIQTFPNLTNVLHKRC